MTVGIRLVGVRGQVFDPPEWVVAFDPDEHAEGQPYPSGMVETSADESKAMRFPNFRDAFEFAAQRSEAVPMRPDGEPNRPLTAFELEIVSVSDILPGVPLS